MTTKERLIAETRELLWDRGYAATSPAAIRQRARAGQGSMYHHFESKHALAVAALTETATDLRRTTEQTLDNAPTAIDALRGYLVRPRDALRGCPVGRMSYDPETLADEDLAAPVRECFEWLEARLLELVRQAQRDGDLNPDLDAAGLAATLIAVIQGGYVLARATGRPDALDRASAGALQLLEHARERRPDRP